MATHNLSGLFAQRLSEVSNYYQQGDVALGYRRLMDAALDTQDQAIYDAVAAHTEWLEGRNPTDAENWAKAMLLLEQIAVSGLTVVKPAAELVLQASGIKKTYAQGVFSLGPIDFALKRGELLGLVGENGNGKTTLLRILAQELRNDQGTLAYHMAEAGKGYDLRSRLAYIPQRTPKWYGPLKDNLKFTLACYGIKGSMNESLVLMVIARMGLWKFRALNWSQLSSGYKMRFELARTLLRRPDILLLDEPLANLDVLAQQTILEDLRSLSASLSAPMGVVLSSQQLYEVEKVSDKVLFLKNGQPLWQQNPSGENEAEPDSGLIVEFDTDAERSLLQAAFSGLLLEKINFNGGTYIVHFSAPASMPQVLSALGDAGVNVIYIRNISKSTRRFFVNQ